MQRRVLLFLVPVVAACGGAPESSPGEEIPHLGTLEQKIALFDYSASNTNYAQDANTSADSNIYLNASETVMIGTCGINESAYSGNTYLRLYNSLNSNVATNDDGSSIGCGTGSKMSFSTSSTGAGYYMIRAGCYSSNSCSGTVAISRRVGTYSFSVSNTNDATINTYNKQLSFTAGDVVRISTCSSNATGASAGGNTYLRLFLNNAGIYSQVATNDTSPCGTAAEIVYTIPTSGYYQFRAGCSTNTACSGTVAVYKE